MLSRTHPSYIGTLVLKQFIVLDWLQVPLSVRRQDHKFIANTIASRRTFIATPIVFPCFVSANRFIQQVAVYAATKYHLAFFCSCSLQGGMVRTAAPLNANSVVAGALWRSSRPQVESIKHHDDRFNPSYPRTVSCLCCLSWQIRLCPVLARRNKQ